MFLHVFVVPPIGYSDFSVTLINLELFIRFESASVKWE